jgi:hypothetical protein
MADLLFRLPPFIKGESAWYGQDMARRTDWIETLSDWEIAELESAMKKNQSADIPTIHQKQFPLPTLGPRLERILNEELLNGRGFALIRTLPVHRWTKREVALAFFGIGTHLGTAVSQNAQGHVLGHVKYLGRSSDDPTSRIYQTRERQTFHTDSCDVVGLLCLQRAKSGGLSSLVSSMTIFNEIRRRRPDLLKLLFEPIETDRRGEVPENQKEYFTIPILNWHAGFLSALYQRLYINSAHRLSDVPPLRPEQIEALDFLDSLANDPALHFSMEFQAGDMQFVHNHTVLHDRTEYEDWPEPERQRHLLRLWLAPANARPLPQVYTQRFGSVAPGNRGGIIVKGTRLVAPLEAE